jgi:hypothetical protein
MLYQRDLEHWFKPMISTNKISLALSINLIRNRQTNSSHSTLSNTLCLKQWNSKMEYLISLSNLSMRRTGSISISCFTKLHNHSNTLWRKLLFKTLSILAEYVLSMINQWYCLYAAILISIMIFANNVSADISLMKFK